jgi:predicted nucleic acid-binding protein
VRTVVLDAGPLGFITRHPAKSPDVRDGILWVASLVEAGHHVVVPEIADYEIRRELLRAGKSAGVARLDAFIAETAGRYVPLTTRDVRLAAELWAQARQQGRPTASDAALDADVLIAAQAIHLGADVIVATGNVSHISRFVAADVWRNIKP